MVRVLILGTLVLAAAAGAAADEAATGTPVLAANGPATTPSIDATKQRVKKKQTASTKAGDGKADPATATDAPAAQSGGDVKMSGMSILGNEDAPKSLVIVPWKSSELADMPSVSRLLDSATQPVDKDVFMRELAYYEFKKDSK
ncbi:MAG TPA: hypothetical protein VMT66_15020 [Steroidobacteraceae bacterium]|nr:hypothetical protein [Steroidobacteraceae bacterium]